MILEVDAAAKEPLYLQIRNQVVAGIATGELVAGMQLPSVRALASDLGINLHTVNKAYAVLRDEGFIRMKGRAGAFIADADDAGREERVSKAARDLEAQLFEAALAYRASGGTRGEFLEAASASAARAYGVVGASREDPGKAAAPERASSPALSVSSKKAVARA